MPSRVTNTHCLKLGYRFQWWNRKEYISKKWKHFLKSDIASWDINYQKKRHNRISTDERREKHKNNLESTTVCRKTVSNTPTILLIQYRCKINLIIKLSRKLLSKWFFKSILFSNLEIFFLVNLPLSFPSNRLKNCPDRIFSYCRAIYLFFSNFSVL